MRAHHVSHKLSLSLLVTHRLRPQRLGGELSSIDGELVAVLGDPFLAAEHVSAEVECGGSGEVGGEVDGTVPLLREHNGSACGSARQ